ncbi:hypothetical protein PLICRDRAFT_178400 [Plicaturopsis crispa FD-325 SS-3]|nr:hypothetical protein PLICRDRAFT_178400 [Plicaturopsis crispa FD-325 SS-3]
MAYDRPPRPPRQRHLRAPTISGTRVSSAQRTTARKQSQWIGTGLIGECPILFIASTHRGRGSYIPKPIPRAPTPSRRFRPHPSVLSPPNQDAPHYARTSRARVDVRAPPSTDLDATSGALRPRLFELRHGHRPWLKRCVQ